MASGTDDAAASAEKLPLVNPLSSPLSPDESNKYQEIAQHRPPPFTGKPSKELVIKLKSYQVTINEFAASLTKEKAAYVRKEEKRQRKAMTAQAKKSAQAKKGREKKPKQKKKKKQKQKVQTQWKQRPCELVPFKRDKSKLGIDIGGVISARNTDPDADTKAAGRPKGWLVKSLQTYKITDECIVAIRALVRKFGPKNTFVVSKCSTSVQQASLAMLGKNDFFQRTGLLETNVVFCKKRSGVLSKDSEIEMVKLELPDWTLDAKEQRGFGKALTTVREDLGKGSLAARYELTHMIDDKAECLEAVYNGYVDSIGGKKKHGGFMYFGWKASGHNKLKSIWRVCGGTDPEAWGHVLECFGLQGLLRRDVSQCLNDIRKTKYYAGLDQDSVKHTLECVVRPRGCF